MAAPDHSLPGPDVTIVIAAYRSRPDHLAAAIESALAQTWRALEILVCDDSPDDRLRALVDACADPRLAYCHNTPARGVAANHWHAFAAARGEFIAVLNHDDCLEPQFVERLIAPLRREPSAVLAFCDHWIMGVDGRRMQPQTDANSRAWGRAGLRAGLHQPFVGLVVHQTIPVAMGCLIRRSALPAHLPADAGPAYDLWLSYLLCRGGGAAWYEPERLGAWRTHATNLTAAGGFDWLSGAARCWSAMLVDPAFDHVRADVRRLAARAWRAAAWSALARGHGGLARTSAAASLAAQWSATSALAWVAACLPRRLGGAVLRARAAAR